MSINFENDWNKLFEETDRYPLWEPVEGDIIAGKIIRVKDGIGNYKDSILLSFEVEFLENKKLTPPIKLSWWLKTQPKGMLCDLSKAKYDKDDFTSVLNAIRTLIGRGLAIKYVGTKESKTKNKYQYYSAILMPDLDEKPENEDPLKDFFSGNSNEGGR